ncbi:MAG: hypothetical protein JO253_00045 [Alphaproteobacteria bacterium]|nr:hypothetical protein [Alphaproteobacteria bacterium]
MGSAGSSCNTACTNYGGCNAAGTQAAASSTPCGAILYGLGEWSNSSVSGSAEGYGVGCYMDDLADPVLGTIITPYLDTSATTCAASWYSGNAYAIRVCACNGGSSAVYGSCGSSANTCTSGTASGYSAGACGGNATWTCLGSNGGTNASCSLANAACPTCGGSADTCGVGSASNYNAGSCGGTSTWTCANGSYTQSCSASNAGCASCSSPCGTISSGSTCTAYASNAPTGACTSQVETCSNGTLSPNNYSYGSCTAGCSATTTTWSSCSGTVAAASAGGTQTVNNTAGGYTGSETATCNAGGSGAFAYSGASCTAAGCTNCALPWGGQQACNTGPTSNAGEYYTPNPTYACSARIVQTTCSSSGNLTCTDNYGDSGCAGPFYTSCTKGSGGGQGCFIGSVRVTMADNSVKPISDLRQGDWVMGRYGPHPVEKIVVRKSAEPLYRINGSSTAFVTAEHIFYTTDGLKSIDPDLTFREDMTHIRVNKLNVGDIILDEHGDGRRVTAIEGVSNGEHTLYNPEFIGDHSYYAEGYLVHNPIK